MKMFIAKMPCHSAARVVKVTVAKTVISESKTVVSTFQLPFKIALITNRYLHFYTPFLLPFAKVG